MIPFLVVALGSAIGGALRHGVNVSSARLLGTAWPYGTFAVNVVGSLAVGALVGYAAARGHLTQTWLLFLTTGMLGGFTTFSTFSLDVVLLYERGRVGLALAYVAASVGVSVAAVLIGLALARRLF